MPTSPKRQKSLPFLGAAPDLSLAPNPWPRSITLPLHHQPVGYPPRTLSDPSDHKSWLSSASTSALASRRNRRSRKSALTRLSRSKPLQLVVLASIPFLVFMLLLELQEHRMRREAITEQNMGLSEGMGIGAAQGWVKPDLELYRRGIRSTSDTRWDTRKGKGKSAERDPGIEWSLWPEWWGNADEVGRSPFDFVPLDHIGPKRRVLFLTDYKDYLERMNTHTYELIDAALRHPAIVVDVWGPGWAGYNASLPLSINVKRRSWRILRLERARGEWEDRMRKWELEVEERMRQISGKAWWDWADVRSIMRVKADVQAGRSGSGPNEEDVPESDGYPGNFIPPEWGEDGDDHGCNDQVHWNIVWTISDIFKQDDPLVDVLDCGALLVQQIGDCHETRCLNEWYPHANNITLSKYAFELMELFEYKQVKERWPDFRMGIFGHSPDTGNEWDFWPVRWNEKKRDSMMFGFDGSFYPIRTTITDHLNSLVEPTPINSADGNTTSSTASNTSLPQPTESDEDDLSVSSSALDDPPPPSFLIQRQLHPGYTLNSPSEAYDNPLETYTPDHPYYAGHIATRQAFARAMRESRVCVFDSSLERKMIRKYAQAMLSGCVIAADLPTEHESALKSFIIPLQPTWDVGEIEQEIKRYLERPDKLEQMALEGFAYARRYLTTTKKVDDVLNMATAYREGERGYIFSHGFSSRCRSYWSGEDAWKSPWCYGNTPQEGSQGRG